MPKTNRKKAAVRPDRKPRRLSGGAWWIVAGVAIIIVIVVVGLVASRGSSGYAQVGDHWHAPITVSVCGENWVPPASDIGSHGMHSHGDGLVHIEPSSAANAGGNAKLKRFFDSLESLRFKITGNSIQLPGGKLYTNGNACPNGTPGTLKVTVNGEAENDFLGYHPKDQDRIVISFN